MFIYIPVQKVEKHTMLMRLVLQY